jgi:hypothetical protein
MSIPWRAARKSPMFQGSDGPGPSAYKIENVGRPRSTPPYVAFHTTSNRSDITAVSQSGASVAPGAYEVRRNLAVQKGADKSNSFRTKISRFAPTAPGSVFLPSTIIENPGPANYTLNGFADEQKRSNLTTKAAKQTSAIPHPAVSEVFNSQQKSAPSVPRPSQAFGYERDDQGRLVLQEAPEETYSGVKSDTIGPAKYFTGEALSKSSSGGVIGFGLSKTRRKVFEAVGSEQVGPGRYTPSLRRLNIANAEGTAAFLSKVPMAHEDRVNNDPKNNGNVGPGAYEADVDGNWQRAAKPSKVQRFLSKDKKGGWDRDIQSPFMDAKNTNPGPGTYGEKRTSFSYRPRKKLTTEKIGFDSSEKRPCLKHDSEGGTTVITEHAKGMGEESTTILANDSEEGHDINTIAGRIKANLNVGATGAFGATDQRFRGGPFDPSKQSQTPGPGAYNPVVGLKGDGAQADAEEEFILTGAKSSSSFRSKTVRFGTNGKGSVSNQPTPDAGAYYNPEKWVKEPAEGRSTQAQNLSFATSNKRFGNKHEQAMIWGTPIGKVPGPGRYAPERTVSVNEMRRKQQHRRNPRVRRASDPFSHIHFGGRKKKLSMTIGLEPRFGAKTAMRGKQGQRGSLGPGAYNTMGSMVKKSFNVTYGM